MKRKEIEVLYIDGPAGDPNFLIGYASKALRDKYAPNELESVIHELANARDYLHLLVLFQDHFRGKVFLETNDPIIMAKLCVADGEVVDKWIDNE